MRIVWGHPKLKAMDNDPMDFLLSYLDFFIHIDRVLQTWISMHGTLGYLFIFLIIFVETGLIFMPFLPGDSLLFMVGTLCGLDILNTALALLTCFMAATLGDQINFWIARRIGLKLIESNSRWVSGDKLDQTHRFFERFGPLTLVIARFLPFVRTFAPFCAGIGMMERTRFVYFNVLGAALWTLGVGGLGYFLGEIPWIKSHVEIVIWALVLIPTLASLASVLKSSQHSKENQFF